MDSVKKAYFQMHTAIFLFGLTAIFGKLISLSELPLVWHRMWLCCLSLILIRGVWKKLVAIPIKRRWTFAGIGVLVALHWITFYGSIKIGNSASVTLACFATTTLFTSFLEPLIMKTRFKKLEVFLGVMVIFGIYLLSGVGSFYYKAIVVGLISAFIAALFSVLNKKYIGDFNSLSITLIELSTGLFFLTLLIPVYLFFGAELNFVPLKLDWLWLLLLSLLCTTVAFGLSLESLKQLSAFIANLSINLEPVYGIILAALIWQENRDLNLNFYLGTGIILLSVFMYPFLMKISHRRNLKRKGILPG